MAKEPKKPSAVKTKSTKATATTKAATPAWPEDCASFAAEPKLPLSAVYGGFALRDFSSIKGLALCHGLLFTLGDDATLCIFDQETGQRQRLLQQKRRSLCYFDVSADGQTIVWGIHGTPVEVYDVKTGKKRHSLPVNDVRSVAISPDGGLVLIGGDRSLHRFDLKTGSPLKPLSGHRSQVNALAFSPDGLYAFSGGGDGVIKRHDLKTGKSTPMTKEKVYAKVISVSPDGERLAALRWSDVCLFDISTGTLLKEARAEARWLSFTPDGAAIVCAGKGLTLLHAATLKLQRTVLEGSFDCAALSADGKTVALTSAGEVNFIESTACLLVEVKSGKVHAPIGHTRQITGASFDDALLSCSWDGRLLRWTNTTQPETLLQGQEIGGLASSPGGKQLILLPAFRGVMTLFDPAKQKGLGSYPKKEERDAYVKEAIFIDQKTILVANGRELQVLPLPELAPRAIGKHRFIIESLAVSHDGTMALTGGQDGFAKLWRLADASLLWESPGETGHFVSLVAFHPGGDEFLFSRGGDLEVCAMATKKQRKLSGAMGLEDLCFSADGAFLVLAASRSLVVKSWPSGKELLSLKLGHEEPKTISFSGDGKRLVVGTARGLLYQFDWLFA